MAEQGRDERELTLLCYRTQLIADCSEVLKGEGKSKRGAPLQASLQPPFKFQPYHPAKANVQAYRIR